MRRSMLFLVLAAGLVTVSPQVLKADLTLWQVTCYTREQPRTVHFSRFTDTVTGLQSLITSCVQDYQGAPRVSRLP
jgi:hypothetical protein